MGFAEELEFLHTLDASEFQDTDAKKRFHSILLKAAKATCDFYIENTP
ncbi:MAG: hypothetical protein U5R06_13100 [candidate division KSB1 bacterium]|nr:hypothetical protein [candidate division KSB1 bacterium]